MTEKDIVSHVKTYYALTDEREILKDIFNLEVLIFKNPSWGISLIGIDEDKGSSSDNTLENMVKNTCIPIIQSFNIFFPSG